MIEIRKFTISLAAISCVSAAAACHPSGPTSRPSLSAAEVQALVDQALPTWDAKVLDVHDGPAWSTTIDPARVLKAMRDDDALAPGVAPPTGRRIALNDRVLRVEPDAGRIRYFHRGRAFTLKDAGVALGEAATATAVVRDAVAALGMPVAELGAVRVDTQVALGGPAGEQPTEQHELYRVVSAQRRINGLPVHGSRVRAAVTRTDMIQRIGVQWPRFVMPRELKLRTREAVIRQVVEAVLQKGAEPAGKRLLTAHLAYAPERYTRPAHPALTTSEDDNPRDNGDDHDETAGNDADAKDARYPSRARHLRETVRYVPVVVVSVLAGETPYQLTVPVAQL